ncbi:hypothetical protein FUAX_05970 [Fulvitalea axinellae]|uniref:Outer membrane protein beta-barrel domain-containing protein n=1 Tax=Fulvitalea axinellae TaxID=1182444 RepID=A0AAU9CG40_9BACT|nr:hypothetical protein FUAX_05970 [Fulvitalea axinellae]
MMKKSVKSACVLVLAILSFAGAKAQRLEYGVKAGYNLASMSGDVGNKPRSGFHVGGSLGGILTRYITVEAELLYSVEGTSSLSPENDEPLKLMYLNMPMAVKYYPIEWLSLRFGPQVGVLLGARMDGKSVTNEYFPVNVGLNVGVGYETAWGIGCSIRYNHSLVNALRNRHDTQNKEYAGYPRSLQLSVEIRF